MGKYNGECVHRESSDELKDHITQVTINDARKSIKLGQMFEYYNRSRYGSGGEYKDIDIVRGRVVAIYENFFTVESDSNGTKEDIKWIDLILAKRKGGRLII